MRQEPRTSHLPAPALCQHAHAFSKVRAASLALVAPLSDEDCQVQSMPDASPAKWHLAHTTWFFENFILKHQEPDFRPFNPQFVVLFNSYYHGIGEQYPRARRGLITRPGLGEIKAYRQSIDERMLELISRQPEDPQIAALLTLGLQHEQQHQELLLTDVKHLLAANPLGRPYAKRWPIGAVQPQPVRWLGFEGGMFDLGHDAALDGSFCFDNETPAHRAFTAPAAGTLIRVPDRTTEPRPAGPGRA